MLCEKCGKEMQTGYGLVGGGVGVYFFCVACGTFKKFQDEETTKDSPRDESRSK